MGTVTAIARFSGTEIGTFPSCATAIRLARSLQDVHTGEGSNAYRGKP